jgi:hypothetical protein
MKVLIDSSISPDHVSTREELEQVMDLLLVLDGPENVMTSAASAVANSDSSQPNPWEDFGASEEQSPAPDIAALTPLFLEGRGRIN